MTTYETSTLILQAAIALVAFATLAIYFHQLRVMAKQLDAMQDSSQAQSALSLVAFLQSADVREARHCVRAVLSKKSLEQWSEEERRQASLVTANYDVAAALLKVGLAPVDLIVSNWGPSIRHCYEVLIPYILEQRSKPGADPRYWRNFEWLHDRVEQMQKATS